MNTERAETARFRYRKARERKFPQTVVFVHHFGGSYISTHRHQDLVLKMGFDCYSFDLTEQYIPNWDGWLPNSLGKFGHLIVEHWARELAAVLDSIEGEKILFTFSYPSTCVPALLGTARRQDVRAWICDGGPFLELFRCQWNLFTYGLHIPGAVKRFILTIISFFIMGGPLFVVKVKAWLCKMDPLLPILSIRAGRDLLVPPRATDKFFAKNPKLVIRRVLFPDAGHLEALKTDPTEYRRQVEGFLQSILSIGDLRRF